MSILPTLERFGQSLVNTSHLLAVKYFPQNGNTLGHGVLVFDNGQETRISDEDAKVLIENRSDKVPCCN